jgi:putative DNA-invertase from lambdoid prophage Rac
VTWIGSGDGANGSTRRVQLGVLVAVAEFERGIIRERVNWGVAAAKECGVRLGRPRKLEERTPEIRRLKLEGFGIRAIARQLKMPVSSVHSVLKAKEVTMAAPVQAQV